MEYSFRGATTSDRRGLPRLTRNSNAARIERRNCVFELFEVNAANNNTQKIVAQMKSGSLYCGRLELFLVNSYQTNSPSNRVGEELAAHEAEHSPFRRHHIVSRGSEGLRIPAERNRPRFPDSTLNGPIRRTAANSSIRKNLSEKRRSRTWSHFIGDLVGKVSVSQPSHLSRP
jgi:hypothetical protein